MKILHTADWHIGQRLHERPRLEEHAQFLDWLLEKIHTHQVDLLLVSGDIFHTALPSADATNLYYRFLHRLFKETDTDTVITAGNHDSARHLEAPREFLKMGRIHVVGLPPEPADSVLLFPQDGPQVAVAAVPYLTESDLGSHDYDETEVARNERYRERLKKFYAECVACMPTEPPKILMGHLYVQGGCVTESERDLQIGGATATHATDFPEGVAYFALGHLHRPQDITGQAYPIRYSGSPIPLRFNETGYKKKVYLLEFGGDGEIIKDEPIVVPVFRELCVVEGNQEAVLLQAMGGEWNGKYIQVKLALDTPQVGVADEIRRAFRDRGGDVLTVEVELPTRQQGPVLSVEATKSPEDIFAAFHKENYEGRSPDADLAETFRELLSMVAGNR